MCAFFFTATLGCCSDIANLSAHLHRLPTPPPYLRRMRLSLGLVRRYPMGDKAVAWPDAAFLQLTFHAGCRYTHYWQGVAWMVRPICAHRAQLQKLIIRLLGIYILKAWKVICRKAHVMLPDANFLSPWCQSPSPRVQNRGFCALLGFGTLVFGHFEHKIEVFVRFWGLEPLFSGFSSTKSGFLCAFALRTPHFPAFRAQNRGFCVRNGNFSLDLPPSEHKISIFVLGKRGIGTRERGN